MDIGRGEGVVNEVGGWVVRREGKGEEEEGRRRWDGERAVLVKARKGRSDVVDRGQASCR